MADGKIYITISDTRGGSGAGVSNEADTGVAESKQGGSKLGNFIWHRFYNTVESQAKQYINYTIGNIGNFTGSYSAQRDAEEGLRITNLLVSTVSSSITAFVAFGGGPQGGVAAAIAATISIGSEAINFAYREKSESFQNRKTNRNIELMRRRLGLEGLTDGSRTGGY